MPNADFPGFHAELARLREQVAEQLTNHRLEVTAAIEALAARATTASGEELAAMRAHIQELERRESALGEKIAAATVEYQALRARFELDSQRQHLRIAELEKQLATREAEYRKQRTILEALMAEHAACGPPAAAPAADETLVQELRARLTKSESECAALRRSIENSVALKVARAVPRLLSPLRALIPGNKS
jgi:DNA repair exonuclease SbcCD ATPase subunit